MSLIAQGKIQSQIARAMNIERSHVSYYVQKAKELGYVKEVARDVVVILELTQAGKNFLAEYQKGDDKISSPPMRLENIRFKARVLKAPNQLVDWKKIEVRNWSQYTYFVDNIHVKYNAGKQPTIEFIPAGVDGDDPYKLFTQVAGDCERATGKIERATGMILDRLEPSSRPEWVVYDPVARSLSQYHGQVRYDGLAILNASKPRSIGEFEFHDPRSASAYLQMPARVMSIEESLAEHGKILQDIHSKLYEKNEGRDTQDLSEEMPAVKSKQSTQFVQTSDA